MIGYSPPYQGADVGPLYPGYFLEFLIICPRYQHSDAYFVLSRLIRLTDIHTRLLYAIVMILLFDYTYVKVVLLAFHYHKKADVKFILGFGMV